MIVVWCRRHKHILRSTKYTHFFSQGKQRFVTTTMGGNFSKPGVRVDRAWEAVCVSVVASLVAFVEPCACYWTLWEQKLLVILGQKNPCRKITRSWRHSCANRVLVPLNPAAAMHRSCCSHQIKSSVVTISAELVLSCNTWQISLTHRHTSTNLQYRHPVTLFFFYVHTYTHTRIIATTTVGIRSTIVRKFFTNFRVAALVACFWKKWGIFFWGGGILGAFLAQNVAFLAKNKSAAVCTCSPTPPSKTSLVCSFVRCFSKVISVSSLFFESYRWKK